jgi:cytoskeletal protein CcmA (bactofilin family)
VPKVTSNYRSPSRATLANAAIFDKRQVFRLEPIKTFCDSAGRSQKSHTALGPIQESNMDNAAAPQSVIAADVEITGTIISTGSVRIDGKLDGELNCTGDAIIGKSAVIKGNLVVNAVTIEGTLNGNVTAKDRIEMKSTARVTGDIKAKRLSVEDGVTFVGRSEVNPSGIPAVSPIAGAPVTDNGEDEKADAASVRQFARR